MRIFWSFCPVFISSVFRNIHPSIHLWCYSPFRALASLIRRFHSSLFAALLHHPLITSSCRAIYKYGELKFLVSFTPYIREVPGSILCPHTWYLDLSFFKLHGIMDFFQKNIGIIPWLGHDCLLQNPLQFIIHQSFCDLRRVIHWQV